MSHLSQKVHSSFVPIKLTDVLGRQESSSHLQTWSDLSSLLIMEPGTTRYFHPPKTDLNVTPPAQLTFDLDTV